jgi:hypothetical protein
MDLPTTALDDRREEGAGQASAPQCILLERKIKLENRRNKRPDWFYTYTNQTGSKVHVASRSIGTGDTRVPGSESDHPLSSAELRNGWNYISIRSCIFIAWCLINEDTRIAQSV